MPYTAKRQKARAYPPKYKGSRTRKTQLMKAKNCQNWSNAFLLKTAGKAALAWKHRVDAGVEL